MLKYKWYVGYCKYDTLSEAEEAAKRLAVQDGVAYLYTATSKFTSPAYIAVTSEVLK